MAPGYSRSFRRSSPNPFAGLLIRKALLFSWCLLGAFKVLLSRYSGQSDIIVGSPIANRERREFEGLIGFFANTLALRTDLSGDPTFVELLARVREVTLRAYDSQEVPFEKLVEELKPERQLNRNPFFDISFSFQNLPTAGGQCSRSRHRLAALWTTELRSLISASRWLRPERRAHYDCRVQHGSL